mgnify:CR=1 FL=1
MKVLVNIARILVGALFIFSGLVKAIDPLGLTYKMQEFFEVWAREGYLPSFMNMLYDFSFGLSVIMITLEVALGVALLVGWRKKLTAVLLFLLILFFTFLTSYVLFSGKIATCGCFGDCIPLTPVQTFTKDIALLMLIIFILWKQKYIQPLFDNMLPLILVVLALVGTTWLQFHVVKHLPVVDCLPFKKGNDILQLRKMPANAIQDKIDYIFIYEKDGKKQEFNMTKLPDSTWKYVDRKEVLIAKGSNNVPVIKDFILTDSSGTDATENVLGTDKPYYLFFIKDMTEKTSKWSESFTNIWQQANAKQRQVIIITSDTENANKYFNITNNYNMPVYTCDVTAMKTAARANPTLFEMKGAVIVNKFSWADLNKVAVK